MVLRSEYQALRAASIGKLTWLTESTLRIITTTKTLPVRGSARRRRRHAPKPP